MNLAKYFTKEGNIAGLEISDSSLRLVLLQNEGAAAPKVIFSLEQKLTTGILSGGQIKNQAAFVRALNNLFERAKPKVKFLVLTIPADHIYAKIFTFPAGVIGEKLESSIRLVTAFQLPKDLNKIYFDWEKLPEQNSNLILISLANRSLIDNLITPIESIGLKVLAVEFHQMSLARVLNLSQEQTVLVIEKNAGSYIFSAIKNKSVRFLRSVPLDRIATGVGQEAERIKNYYEAEEGLIGSFLTIGDFAKDEIETISSFLKNTELIQFSGDVAQKPVAFGAASRGLIPRADDKLISLMESGTEEAYEQEKALIFTKVLSRFTITFALFLTLAYLGTWFLAQKIQANFNRQISNFSAMPISAGAQELDDKAKNFNALVSSARVYYDTLVQWSPIVNELKILSGSTTLLTSLSLTSPEQPIMLTGVARNRQELNTFKQLLEESPFFRDAILPLENLDKKNNIPFKITATIENPALAYPKK